MSDNREMIVLNGEQIDELVRCKDCKHSEDAIMSGWYCLITKDEIRPDDFCSRGERREE